MFKLRMFVRALAFVPWLGFVVYLSHVPKPLGGEMMGYFDAWRVDLLVHFFEYLILGVLGSAAITLFVRHWWWLIVVGLGFVVAIVDEWTQALVPGRVPDPIDGLADLVGILGAVLVYWAGSRWLKGRQLSG